MSDTRITNTILVVDDAPENIDLLDGVLNKDYKIKAALNGEKALKIAGSENPPDIIPLDLILRDMTVHSCVCDIACDRDFLFTG